MEVFQDYAYYYNTFYRDKDYKRESSQVDMLLKRYGNNIRKIINFGCGTGKHDIELTKLGYQCTGLDISSLMIAIAKENSRDRKLQIDFAIADICGYEPTQKYDAVISLFHVMSYQNSNEKIMAAFRTARKALGNEGLFLFDIWYGPGVLSDRPCTRIKEVEDDRNRLVRIARPIMHAEKNVVDVCYEVFVIDKETGNVKVINEVHNMRYYFRPELETYLMQAGFKLVDSLDCATLGEPDYNSWTSYFIAKAI